MKLTCTFLLSLVLSLFVDIPLLLAADQWPAIQKKGVLRILASADEDPGMWNLRQEGEPGFEKELLLGFAALHKVKLEVVPVDQFGTILRQLNAGDGDLIIGIIINDERKKSVDFTLETMPVRHVVLNHRSKPPILNLAQLSSERVGTVAGSSWWSMALSAGIPEKNLIPLKDRFAIFEALKTGQITATVMSLSDATLAMKANAYLQPGPFVGPSGSAGWAVRKSDVSLKAALDTFIGATRLSQTWSRLIVKYFGEDALVMLKKAREK